MHYRLQHELYFALYHMQYLDADDIADFNICIKHNLQYIPSDRMTKRIKAMQKKFERRCPRLTNNELYVMHHSVKAAASHMMSS